MNFNFSGKRSSILALLNVIIIIPSHDNTLKGERFVPGARYNYVVTGGESNGDGT